MSSSSSRKTYQEPQAEEKMRWLSSFLEKTFFGACDIHGDLQNSDMNRYCVTCDVSACKHCIESDLHGEHKLLKIYRHVYKDVVPLADMETQIDCSKIQAYRCNKIMVIALNPLPHKGSGEANKEGSCKICRRKLYEPNLYRFCSITCKVKASSEETDDSKSSVGKDQTPENDETEPPAKKRHRRKGIPCRAPHF